MPDGGILVIETGNKILAEERLVGTLRLPPGRYIRLSMKGEGVGGQGTLTR